MNNVTGWPRENGWQCLSLFLWYSRTQKINMKIEIFVVLLVSQQRISIKLCTHSKLCNEANPLWWQFTSSRASREWTGTLEQMERVDVSSPEAIRHYSDDQYVPEERTSGPKRFSQQELNDLNRDLSLSKDKAELLASRLKERYLSESYDRVCHYRIRNNVLKIFFRVEGPMVFYHDFNGLFRGLKQEQNSSDCQLFIDSLQWSLKAVLLHNGNPKHSIPIAHSVRLKESYDNMIVILKAILISCSPKEHPWRSEGDWYADGYARRLYEVLLLLMPLG